VLHMCFVTIWNHSLVICVFLYVNNGGLSILAAEGRLEPEVTSLFDSSTAVFY
jgi:hypothetical protein